MIEEIKILEFDKNDNNKFNCLNFLAIVPPISLYEQGDRFQIKIAGKHFCYAEVIIKKDL